MNTKRKNVVHQNASVAKKLLANNTFYFVVRHGTFIISTEFIVMRDSQDGVQGKRRFENKTVLRALQRAFFNGTKSFAAVYHTKFNPIPLASIAIVCTIVRCSTSFSEIPQQIPTHCALYRSNTVSMNGNLESTFQSISMKPSTALVTMYT